MIKTISFISDPYEAYKGVPVLIKQKLGPEEAASIASIISTSLNSFFRSSIYPLPLPENLMSTIGDSFKLTAAEREEAASLGINFFTYIHGTLAFVWNSLGIRGLDVQETISLARIYRKILKIYESGLVYDPREFKRKILDEIRCNLTQILDYESKICRTLKYKVDCADSLNIVISCNEFESHITVTPVTFIIDSNLKEISDIFWESWKPE